MTGETLKQQGLALVDSHTPGEWKERFAFCGRRLAAARDEFTAEDVLHFAGPPANPNAVGAAMHALARELKLVRVGYRPAKRPSRHAGAVAVWRAP